jgi:hypothetical protein
MEILTEVIKWSYFWKYDYGERHNCLLIMLMQGVILMEANNMDKRRMASKTRI